MMRQLTLPGGLTVFSLNADETRFVYREVFAERCYLQHGVELRDCDCVFDVGAHIGLASIFFHRERKNLRLFAFEPSPAACECLRANLALHGVDARIFECGLGRVSGAADFTFYPANAAASGFRADAATDRAATRTYMLNSGVSPRGVDRFLEILFRKTTLPRPLRTLSGIVDEEQIARIDLLKINVEKSERDVLAGIRAPHWEFIHQVVVEVFDENGGLREVTDLLDAHGFHVIAEQDPLLRGTPYINVFATRL